MREPTIRSARSVAVPHAMRLAVLDMAGTTVAVTDAVPDAMVNAFRSVGVRIDAASIATVRGRSKREAVRDLLREGLGTDPSAEDVAAVLASFRDSLRARYAHDVAPIPGAADVIRWLRGMGVAVVLTTGFDRDLTTHLLERLGWNDDLVSAVVTDDDVARGRPEPDLILRAMALTGIDDPATVLVAGDTAADLVAASRANAGIVIAVSSGAHSKAELALHPHTALLDSIADLPAWCRSRSGVRS